MVTEKDVYTFFGRTYASRGSAYQRQGAVRAAIFDSAQQKIIGQVKGTQSDPYEVAVALNDSAADLFEAHCSCPMGGLCKHSAALVLHLIRTTDAAGGRETDDASGSEAQGSLQKQTISKSFETWLGDLQSAAGRNKYKSASAQNSDAK